MANVFCDRINAVAHASARELRNILKENHLNAARIALLGMTHQYLGNCWRVYEQPVIIPYGSSRLIAWEHSSWYVGTVSQIGHNEDMKEQYQNSWNEK